MNTNPTAIAPDMRISTLIKRSWQLLLDNWLVVIGAFTFHAVRNMVIALIVLFFVIDSPSSPFLMVGVLAILFTSSYLDGPSICLNIVRGKPIRVSFLPNFQRTLPWLMASLLFFLAVAIGSVFFLIPGLIIAVLFSMYGFGIVDGDNPIAALSKSLRIARRKFWQISAIVFGSFIICLLPIAHYGLSLAIDVAVTLALCIIYTSASGSSN
jgi:hypothetical protein